MASASTYTRIFSCSFCDGARKVYLTRESKRLARQYAGVFRSFGNPCTMKAEYAVTYRSDVLLILAARARRRKACR